MDGGSAPLTRCGIDRVEIARIERLVRDTPYEDLLRIFSADELCDAGTGTQRAANLAARFAAKEACLKLFPRETALGEIELGDFAVVGDGCGGHRVVCAARARGILDRYRLKAISLALTFDMPSASAVVTTEAVEITAPLRCSIAAVSMARIGPLLHESSHADRLRLFSRKELQDMGGGLGRAARLAARLAAKEACLSLFPREAGAGQISAGDFTISCNGYGAPRVDGPKLRTLLDRHGMNAIALSLTHDRLGAAAVAVAEPAGRYASDKSYMRYRL